MVHESPFHVSPDDIEELEQSDGYRIVRQYLSDEPANSFCSQHHSLSRRLHSEYLDHCTIIHSILLPLLQIRQQASHRARAILPQQRGASDLELAFKGAARGAFSWLQCFTKEEWDWCITSGCPACSVNKVMQAEPFIRIIIAGCRLSEYLQDLLGEHDRRETCAPHYGSPSRAGNHGPLLPTFSFFLASLHTAVQEDEFWGLHFWEDIEVRALDLEEGIKDLISQCCEICNPSPPSRSPASSAAGSRTSSPPTRPQEDPLGAPQYQPLSGSQHSARQPANKVKNSRLAKCQIKLQREEQEWMNRIVEACWKSLVVEAAMQRRNSQRLESKMVKPADGLVRTRSLTA